jgi:hypothetical protein
MGLSLVYTITLAMFLIAALRSGALLRLLLLLGLSVAATLVLALMKYDENFLWAALIVPPALFVTSVALTSMFDRIARKAWHQET